MDSLTVEENIMLPMILGKEKVDVMTKAVTKYAEHFQIAHLLKKNPYELSGGEKQRVAICRVLINRKLGKTIVMVTHDPQMASNCRRIILLKDGVILDTLNRGENQEAFYREIIGRMADL